MVNLSSLKAVFFDLDDTLVFSESMHTKSWSTVLTNLGVDISAIDFKKMVGTPETVEAKNFIERFDLKESIHSLVERKREMFLSLATQGFDSALGRNHFLQKVSSSYTIGVVSASAKSVIEQVLHVEKIHSFFNFVIGHEDCERPKPDPFPYQHALALANVKPHEALVIEDSPTGITSALKACIPVFGILKDQRADQIIKDVPYFNNFDEINNKLFGS